MQVVADEKFWKSWQRSVSAPTPSVAQRPLELRLSFTTYLPPFYGGVNCTFTIASVSSFVQNHGIQIHLLSFHAAQRCKGISCCCTWFLPPLTDW